ncbi:molybdate ABC transporter, ATPase subunit [Thioalkalivibrio sulfidiphilus HL-EbGr7]|uniref:Molybdate ABC transporter, ATPase subunit n=1 Tax=Thioalkalivibrio sulfidiphilus (strain HL-EbGR7) TaxID=396588 RepID=B8GRV0_THISH|nr:molybdenum ABC transporter ATP-binding protein [Thioalkalivibrio sulfidiphilus]ACL72654.1 molybdate ABC transporter, ATPase subunit [Thioalkalivibrio sulfidiphilus HL-EbGr7]
MSIDLHFDLKRPDFHLDVESRIPVRGVTALFGRSGCGKTTLLRCIAGLEPSARGRLVVDGETWQDARHFLPAHNRPVGYVFQEGRLFPHLSVQGNLEYGYRRISAGQRVVQPDEVIDLLGLEALLARRPGELSGGQRQRVAMGRALLTSPRVLLMDEPLAALDAISKTEILPYLERLHDELSIPVLYVSHSIDEVMRLADHMLLLEGGRLRAEGPIREMTTRGDLPLARAEEAVALLEAEVLDHDDEDHVSILGINGARLTLLREDLPVGRQVRLSIHARDVSIALTPPAGISVLNCLPATVREIHEETRPGEVLLGLDVCGQPLLARISRRSLRSLGLMPGMQVHALIKAVALVE